MKNKTVILILSVLAVAMWTVPVIKFSRQFSDEVSWQKVDPTAAAAASGEEDITEGGAGQGGNQGGGTTGGELEG